MSPKLSSLHAHPTSLRHINHTNFVQGMNTRSRVFLSPVPGLPPRFSPWLLISTHFSFLPEMLRCGVEGYHHLLHHTCVAYICGNNASTRNKKCRSQNTNIHVHMPFGLLYENNTGSVLSLNYPFFGLDLRLGRVGTELIHFCVCTSYMSHLRA